MKQLNPKPETLNSKQIPACGRQAKSKSKCLKHASFEFYVLYFEFV